MLVHPAIPEITAPKACKLVSITYSIVSAEIRKNYVVKIYRFISQLCKTIYASTETTCIEMTCIETTGKPAGVV